jgi:DNA mismatch repair protein MutL
MPIQILSPEVASQIAAGEVVERPASVVKELLENALDARANRISIRVEGAGQRLVELADDGVGIPANELAMAVARHATSKLQSADDLFRIATLGFRGEALASIGSVARLMITSRLVGADTGSRLRVEGGKIGACEPVGAAQGTVVRVEDLFYNVPARLKFLKKEQTERRQIDELVTRYALAYPGTHFQLQQEGRVGLQTTGSGDRREILALMYGVDIARQLLEVNDRDDGMKIQGFISPANLTRANRREMIFFVNGRPIQDPALSAAVMQAYHTLLMVGRFPMVVLFLTLPPDRIDVNVHPTKAEVRFREASQVFTSLQRAVRRNLLAYTPVPDAGSLRWGVESPAFPSGQEPSWQQRQPSKWDSPLPGAEQLAPDVHTAQQASPGKSIHLPILRLIGQIAATYLVAEGSDGLYLVDQHAAHERILFEQLMSRQPANPDAAQTRQALLQPVSVHLPPAGARLLEDQLPVLARLGFDVEPFGPGTYQVRALPIILAHMSPSAALFSMVEEFEEDETPLQAAVEARVAARVCKRAAVKAGQVLSQPEQARLLADLEACESPRTCPHGRPTMIHLSVDLLERQFGRRGAR